MNEYTELTTGVFRDIEQPGDKEVLERLIGGSTQFLDILLRVREKQVEKLLTLDANDVRMVSRTQGIVNFIDDLANSGTT